MSTPTLEDYLTAPAPAPQSAKTRKPPTVPTYTVELDDGVNVVITRTAGHLTSKLCLLVGQRQCFVIDVHGNKVDLTPKSAAAFMRNSADKYVLLENCIWCEGVPMQNETELYMDSTAQTLVARMTDPDTLERLAAGLIIYRCDKPNIHFPDSHDTRVGVELLTYLLDAYAKRENMTPREFMLSDDVCYDSRLRVRDVADWAASLQRLFGTDAAKHGIDVVLAAPDLEHRSLRQPTYQVWDSDYDGIIYVFRAMDPDAYIEYLVHGADRQGLSAQYGHVCYRPLNWCASFGELWLDYAIMSHRLDPTLTNWDPMPDDLLKATSDVTKRYLALLAKQSATGDVDDDKPYVAIPKLVTPSESPEN